MKKVIKIVLVVKEEEPKQLQQKHPLEMQKSTMSYGMVSWCTGGENTLPWGSSLLVVELLKEWFISSSETLEYNLEKNEITTNENLSTCKIKFGKKTGENSYSFHEKFVFMKAKTNFISRTHLLKKRLIVVRQALPFCHLL